VQDFFHPQYVTWGDRFWSIPSSIPFQSHFNILGAQTVNHPYHELSQLVGLPSDLGYQSKVCAPATRRSGWWRFISVCCFCGRQKPQADHHINSKDQTGIAPQSSGKGKRKGWLRSFIQVRYIPKHLQKKMWTDAKKTLPLSHCMNIRQSHAN